MIFKKHFSVLMTFFLLVSNLGLAFNVHYCDDTIASISLNTAPEVQQKVDECCGVVEKDSKCCNDKVIKAQSKSDQIIAKTLSFEPAFFEAIDLSLKPFFLRDFSAAQHDRISYYCEANAPPLYLLYSQYTFYA